ncbi:MAG: hypothetical protein AB2A00_30290 [Myxococcota bacterium]
MRARPTVMVLALLGALLACPPWLTLATCSADADCDTGYCGPDGLCVAGTPPSPGALPCGECLTEPHAVTVLAASSAPLLPAHSADALVPGVVVLDEDGRVWVVAPDGGVVLQHQWDAGNAAAFAALPGSGARPPMWVVRQEDDPQARFYALDGGVLEESLPAVASAPAQQPPVTLSHDDAGLVAIPDRTGQVTVTAAGLPQRPVTTLLNGVGGPLFVSACPELGLLVADSAAGLSVMRYAWDPVQLSPSLTPVLPTVAEDGITPVTPPVIVVEAPGRVAVYGFRNLPGARVTRLTVELGEEDEEEPARLLEPPHRFTSDEPLSGPPVVVREGGEARVALPSAWGSLRVVRRESDGQLSATRWRIPSPDGGAPLLGAVSLHLNPQDPSDTVVVGDLAGWVMAVRSDGPVAVDAGWPFRLPGAVEVPPVVRAHGERLMLNLVTRGDGGVLVHSRLVGRTSAGAAPVWPEYQHDDGNSGCIHLAP